MKWKGLLSIKVNELLAETSLGETSVILDLFFAFQLYFIKGKILNWAKSFSPSSHLSREGDLEVNLIQIYIGGFDFSSIL
jgi:hypothetical protein